MKNENVDSTFYMKWKKLNKSTVKNIENQLKINHHLFTAYIFIEKSQK